MPRDVKANAALYWVICSRIPALARRVPGTIGGEAREEPSIYRVRPSCGYSKCRMGTGRLLAVRRLSPPPNGGLRSWDKHRPWARNHDGSHATMKSCRVTACRTRRRPPVIIIRKSSRSFGQISYVERDLMLNCLGWEMESGLVQVLEREKGRRNR
jgi:hypothetical protein